MSDFLRKLGREWLIALPGTKSSMYLNHCASSNKSKLPLSCDPILKCVNLDVDPDTGSSTNKKLDIFVNKDYSYNFENGSVSWFKFAPSRILYNDSPYMLYESLIDSTPISKCGLLIYLRIQYRRFQTLWSKWSTWLHHRWLLQLYFGNNYNSSPTFELHRLYILDDHQQIYHGYLFTHHWHSLLVSRTHLWALLHYWNMCFNFMCTIYTINFVCIFLISTNTQTEMLSTW